MALSANSVYAPVLHKKKEGTLKVKPNGISFTLKGDGDSMLHVAWPSLLKHQISPSSYPKALLKLVVQEKSPLTFQLPSRGELDRIKEDISRKRKASTLSKAPPSSFETDDSTSLAVTRASLLAAHPALRQQHALLVPNTLNEDDFWSTHSPLVQDANARLAGLRQAGTSSLLQSHLPLGKTVTLGVEEMRQIFILYPAVHQAYEEKVPLELSEEQFWRKYLESEYFHRDRGRMGSSATKNGPSVKEQEARAAAVGTDDLFSRYAQKLEQRKGAEEEEKSATRKWGQKLGVGQFDLASTFATERGELLEGPKDNHPETTADGKGSRVISKYNRHWAMVLHPDKAVAGCNLTQVARKSTQEIIPDDDDAKVFGGVDTEMRQLVDFACTSSELANHASGLGSLGADYNALVLENIEAYYSGNKRKVDSSTETSEEARKRYRVFVNAMAAKTQGLVQTLQTSKSILPESSFPPVDLGKDLLAALTRKMASDAMTSSASMEIVNKLPKEFRDKLQTYFRRCSELLRHFFALRRFEAQRKGRHGQKLSRIVTGMETVYREMETMRKEAPQTETGETMRKMCLPIMEQLDWAFKLRREGSGGGFVTVEGTS